MATIRKRGVKWQVQIRRKGQCPLSRSFRSKKHAEAWAREMERRADLRELPHDLKLRDQYTLGDLVRRYRDTVTPQKRGGDYERIILAAFLRHRLCSKRLSDITPRDFAAYRDERLRTIKPSSLRRQLNPLQNLFEVAKHEWGIPVAENPLRSLKLPVVNSRRERRLHENEIEGLIAAAQACRSPFIAPIILFAIKTGMWRGELLALKWQHIDRQRRSLVIPQTKNGFSRNYPAYQSDPTNPGHTTDDQ